VYHILEKEKEKCYNDLMQKSNFELEKELYGRGYDFVIGVDEAGRGPLAGPVVAVAATIRNFEFRISNFESNPNDKILNGDKNNNKNIKKNLLKNSKLKNSKFNQNSKLEIQNWNLIRDSKTLSEKQRENIYDFITENFFVGVGMCDHKTIDRMNILQASFLAMKKALTNLQFTIHNLQSISNDQISNTKTSGKTNAEKKINDSELKNSKFNQNSKFQIQNFKRIILIDGDKKIPNFSGEQIAVPRGDQKIKSISAASIIAKVTRDRMMREAHKKYPRYGFNRHKGYGTKLHMEALRKFGPCEIHRRSFKPVGKFFDPPSHLLRRARSRV